MVKKYLMIVPNFVFNILANAIAAVVLLIGAAIILTSAVLILTAMALMAVAVFAVSVPYFINLWLNAFVSSFTGHSNIRFPINAYLLKFVKLEKDYYRQ